MDAESSFAVRRDCLDSGKQVQCDMVSFVIVAVNSTAQANTPYRDTTNPPKQITNSVGRVILRNTAGFLPGAGGFNEPLASNFSIFDGVVEVEVPDVPGDDDYQVVRE